MQLNHQKKGVFYNFVPAMSERFRTYPILEPLALLFRAATAIRNHSYDRGILKTVYFPFPVISVGNITVGGTGKTPHTEYIVSLLHGMNGLTVLSRGYGRCSTGFVLADEDTDSTRIGDEPSQIHTHFPDITVAVDEDRVHGIRLLSADGNIGAVILDDAFQHRRVRPSLNILLVNWNRNIMHDRLMPAGRLREAASGRSRADIIIVTKCPAHITDGQMDSMTAELAVRPGQEVFFSTFAYGEILPFSESCRQLPQERVPVLSLSGIASPSQMNAHLAGLTDRLEQLTYPDHYHFDNSDIDSIIKKVESMGTDAIIVTTEKDAARLKSLNIPEELRKRIYVLPIKVKFIRGGQEFDRIVTEHVKSFKSK